MPRRSLAFVLTAASTAAALTALAVVGRVLPGEASLARWLQDAPLGRGIANLADILASPFVEYALVATVAVAALRARRYALAAAALLAFAGMALNPAIKELVHRDRPTDADIVIREHAGGFGFPSGHVQSATLAYGYASACAARLLARSAARLVGAALIPIAAIGFNRVYNGVHWPSDVAGGLLIGALLVVLSLWLPESLQRRFEARAVRSTPGHGEFG